MEFSYAILVLLTTIAFLFYYYLLFSKHSSKSKNQKSPPKAGGAWPIIGHVQLMGGGSSSTQLPHITLAGMAEKYGPIFTVQYGVNQALIINNWESVKEMFTTYDVALSTRPRLKAAKYLGYNFTTFGFSPYGPYWTQMRKLISLELLSSRKVDQQQHLYASETSHSINQLYRLWAEKKDEEEESSGRRVVMVEMRKWFGDLTLNLILLMIVGKRFIGDSLDQEEEEEKTKCLKVMRDFFQLNGLIVPADALPWLGWLDLGGYEKKMKKTAKELDALVGQWLDEHKTKDYSDDKSKPLDFMDVMISSIQGDANLKNMYDPDVIVKSACATLIAGATDTTAIMLVWTLCLLLNNRRVLQKAQEELDVQIGKNRRVNESDINNLVYLHAIIKETLRLYPAGRLGGFREFTEDCNVGGYHVPKGTWLMVNLWKMQRDPRVWPDDPFEFRPERFLTTHTNVDVKGQDFELIPFGSGRRMCPGIHMGTRMLLFILASFLHGFEVSTPREELVDMTEIPGLTNSKATPLDVLLAPRLSHSLYN